MFQYIYIYMYYSFFHVSCNSNSNRGNCQNAFLSSIICILFISGLQGIYSRYFRIARMQFLYFRGCQDASFYSGVARKHSLYFRVVSIPLLQNATLFQGCQDAKDNSSRSVPFISTHPPVSIQSAASWAQARSSTGPGPRASW